jgi:hypothetical protein
MTKIRGSRAISSPSASSVACMKLISCIAPSGFEVPSSVGSVPGGSSYTNRVADAASGQGDASANCRASSTAASTSASVTPFAILQRFFTDPLRLQEIRYVHQVLGAAYRPLVGDQMRANDLPGTPSKSVATRSR